MAYSNDFCLRNQNDYGIKMIKVSNNNMNQLYLFKKQGSMNFYKGGK